MPQPWDDIEDRAPVGATLTGTVRRLTTFGAFVEVFPGVEGLVHISQISHEHIATPNDVLKEGEEVNVKVLSVDPEQRRLALSIKALKERPAGDEPSEPRKENARPRRNNNNNNNHTSIPAEYQQDDSGFSLGDILGDALKDAAKDDNE